MVQTLIKRDEHIKFHSIKNPFSKNYSVFIWRRYGPMNDRRYAIYRANECWLMWIFHFYIQSSWWLRDPDYPLSFRNKIIAFSHIPSYFIRLYLPPYFNAAEYYLHLCDNFLMRPTKKRTKQWGYKKIDDKYWYGIKFILLDNYSGENDRASRNYVRLRIF